MGNACPPLNLARGLLLRPRVTFFDQSLKFFILLRDAVGRELLVLGSRKTRGLFDQLPDVVAKYRDAVVEFA